MKCQYVLNLPFNAKIYFGTCFFSWFEDSNSKTSVQMDFFFLKILKIQYVTHFFGIKKVLMKSIDVLVN